MSTKENLTGIPASNSDADQKMFINLNSDKPIIQLFKRLMSNDSKQSTVLTNTQIVEILNDEFNIQISNIHELEGDIYLTIMKKFLKDWPQWDELDVVVNSLSDRKDYKAANKLLKNNYVCFKKYLSDILDMARDITKTTVNKVIDESAGTQNDNVKESAAAVVLEILASRNQLNQLFFRQPQPNLNNSVFNCRYNLPSQIIVNTLPLEAILNWWDVTVSITSISKKVVFYRRRTTHVIEHILVNRKLIPRYDRLVELPQCIQVNSTTPLLKINTSDVIKAIDQIPKNNCKEIIEFIKTDVKLLPSSVFPRVLHKRYMNKYPYIRYLYKHTERVEGEEAENSKYDLQLKETVSPQYVTMIGSQVANPILSVYCTPCKVSYSGDTLVEDLKSHFNEHHVLEPDFICTNCSESFPMAMLAKSWWAHRC